MQVKETFSEKETYELAKNLAMNMKEPKVVCLNGDLGVGKTVFAKGFAKGLGIDEDITSPTFTIVQSYKGIDMNLHHFDVYRISDISEMDEIGYEEYFFDNAICLIEWSKLIEEIIPSDAIEVLIEKDITKGVDYRKISVSK